MNSIGSSVYRIAEGACQDAREGSHLGCKAKQLTCFAEHKALDMMGSKRSQSAVCGKNRGGLLLVMRAKGVKCDEKHRGQTCHFLWKAS